MNDDEHVGKDILVYSQFFQKKTKTGLTRVCLFLVPIPESVLLSQGKHTPPSQPKTEFFEGGRG